MSTILEALRKSERARRHRQAPVYRDASSQETPAMLRWLALTAGVVLLVALGVSAWLMWRSPVEVIVSPPSPNAAPLTTRPAEERVAKETNTVLHTPTSPSVPQPLFSQTAPDSEEPITQRSVSESAAVVPLDNTVHGQEVPWLSSLPASFRNRLPVLVVNIHVFAEDEAQRILYINNHPYKQGEQIQGGVVVEAIVPDGVVLRAYGQRFKLPRPT
jgi:hypothetical protein